MEWYKATLTVATKKKGMLDFTALIEQHLRTSGIEEGMCFLYIQHTSASLVISESYDRSAQQDMESYHGAGCAGGRVVVSAHPGRARRFAISYPRHAHKYESVYSN